MKKFIMASLMILVMSVQGIYSQTPDSKGDFKVTSTAALDIVEKFLDDNCRSYVMKLRKEEDDAGYYILHSTCSSSMSKENVMERLKTFCKDLDFVQTWRYEDTGLNAMYLLDNGVLMLKLTDRGEDSYSSYIWIGYVRPKSNN